MRGDVLYGLVGRRLRRFGPWGDIAAGVTIVPPCAVAVMKAAIPCRQLSTRKPPCHLPPSCQPKTGEEAGGPSIVLSR